MLPVSINREICRSVFIEQVLTIFGDILFGPGDILGCNDFSSWKPLVPLQEQGKTFYELYFLNMIQTALSPKEFWSLMFGPIEQK